MANKKRVPPSDRMRIMDVAKALKCRYQKARDMMLAERFGPVESEPLSVARTGVEAYLAAKAGTK